MNPFIHIAVYLAVTTLNIIFVNKFFFGFYFMAVYMVIPVVTIVHVFIAIVDYVFKSGDKISFMIYLGNSGTTFFLISILLFMRGSLEAKLDMTSVQKEQMDKEVHTYFTVWILVMIYSAAFAILLMIYYPKVLKRSRRTIKESEVEISGVLIRDWEPLVERQIEVQTERKEAPLADFDFNDSMMIYEKDCQICQEDFKKGEMLS